MKNDQINARELAVILRELTKVLEAKVEGDIVELGCYKGMTSVELQKIIKKYGLNKRLYLYDSFAGLPPKGPEDGSALGEQFKAGELPASKKAVIRYFKQTGMPLPIIKTGWFSELENKDLPNQVAFAFLDGDFYASIKDSLKLVWPKLTQGSVIVIDDYQNEALPGVQKTVDEWLHTYAAKLRVEASLAIISKM